MTTTVPGFGHGWAAAHRRLIAVVALAVAIAVAVTVAITLLVPTSSSAPSTPRTVTSEWPVDPGTLTDKEKCELARVRVC